VAELLAVSKPVSEWVDVFGVLGSAEEELPLDEVERRLQFLSVARAHKTPRKAEPSSPFVFGGDDLDLMLEPVPEEILKGSEFEWSRALPGDLVSALEVFGRTVSSLASTVPTALSEAAVKADKDVATLTRAGEQMNARLISLECVTGERLEDVDELPPTLWEAVAALWSRCEETRSPLHAGSGEGVSSGEDLGRVARAIGSVQSKVEKANEASLAVAAELDKFQEKVGSLFGLVSRKMADVVNTQNDTTRELGRVSGLVSAAKGTGDSGGGSGGLDSLLASLGGGGGGGEDDLGALRKEVAALRKEVRLSKDKDAESVKIGGLQFKTREDLAAYLLDEAPGLPFGTIVDYHALMQQVHYDLGGYESVDSILKGLKLRSDMALETTADVLALASIRRGIPALLGEGKPATGEDRSSFNAFHSFADWKNSNGRDGLVNTLPASQQQAREAIEADIETRLVPGSPGAMLAQTCLAKSVTFSDAFTKYLTTTYEDLTQASGFPKKRAWALTTALGARVCKEIHKESVALARSLAVAKDETGHSKGLLSSF
jgi:hypothetical protein